MDGRQIFFFAGSREVEAFIVNLEQELLVHLDEMVKKDKRKKHSISSGIDSFCPNSRRGPI